MATEASIPEDASAKQNTELEDRDLKMGQLDSISNECSREGSVKPSCGFNQFPQGFECSSEAEKADIVGDQTKNIMTTSTRTPKDISSEELSSPDKAQTEDISDLIVNQELIHICENEKHHSKDIATGADKNEVINGINVEEEHVHEKANDAAQVSRLACAEEPILKVHEEESLDQNLQVVKNQNASTQAISEIMETEMISSQKNENTTSKGEKDSNLECNEQARSIFEANLGPINEDLLPNLDWAAKSLGNEDERMIESCIKDEDIDSNNTKYAEDEYKEITLKAGQNKKKEMPSALEGERKAPESVVSSDKSEHCYEEHKLMHDRTEDASTVNVAESPYSHSFEEATLKTTSKNEASTEGVALEAGESMNEASSKACQEKNKDNESIWQEKDVPPVDGKDKAEKSAWLNRHGGGAKEDEFSQIGLLETIENSKTTPLNAEKSTEQNEQQDKLGGHVALIPENTEIVAPRENAEKSTEQVRHAIEKYEEEEEEEKDEPTSITDSGETLFPTEKSHLLVESITKNESAELKIPQKNASDVDSKYPLVEKTEQAESVETGEISKTEQTCAENENQAEDQSEEESKGTELGKVPKAHTDEKVEIVDGGKIIPKEAKEGKAANDMQLHKTATESVPENEATSRLSSTEFIRDEAIEQGFQEESIKDAELTLATDNESPRQESIKDVERNTKVDEAFDEPSTGRENTSDVTSEGSSADASGVPKNTTCMAVVDDSKKNEAEIQEVGEQSNAENSVSKSQEKENTARTLSSASGMETGKEYPEEDLNEETRMKEEVHVMIAETKEQIEAAYSTERKISSTSDDFLEPKENHGDLTTEENKNNLVENSPSISGVFEKDDCSTNDSETDFLKVASEGNTAMKEVKPVNEERLETSDAAPENRNIETIEKKANSLDNVNIDEKQEEETISEENRNMKAADVADEADEGGQQMSHDIKDKALITRIDHEKEVTISTPEKTPARDDTLYVDSQTSFIVHSNSMLGSSDNEHENADEGIQKHPDEDLMTLKTENNISGTEETEQWKGEQFSGLADENDASKLEIVKDEKSIVDVSKNINDVSCNEKAELEDEEVAEKAEANSAVVGVEREAAELTKAGSSTTEEESTDTKNAELADKNVAFKLEIVKEEKSTVEVLKHIEDVSSYSLDNEKAELQDEELVEKYEANSSVSVERKAPELKAGSSITDEEPADTKDNELEDENEASQLEIVEDESTVEVPKHIEDVSCMDNEKAELEDEEVTEKAEANSAVVGVEREAAELIKAGSSTTEEEPADTKNAELVDKNAAFKLEIVKEEKSTVEVLKHIEDVSSRSLDNEKAELEDEELVEKYEANSSVGTEREAAELNAGSSITEEEPVGTKDDELEDENEASQLEIVEDESTVEVPKHIEDVSWMDNEKTDMEDEELVEKVEGNSAVAVVEREATELDAVSSSTEEEPANTKNDELLIEKADRTYENIPCESDHNVESHEKILDMSLQKKEESLLGEHDNSTQEGASIDDQHEHAYSAIVMEDNGEKSGLVKGKDQDAKITLKCGEYLKQTLLNDGREKLEEISDIISEGSKEDASREYTENTSTIREPTTIRLEKISHKENVEEKVNAVDGTKENEAENPEVLVTDGASQATSEKIIKVCESSNSETSVLKSQEEIENPVGTLSSASVGKEKGKEYPNDDKNEDTKIMEEVQVTNSESKEEIEETFVIYREISNTLHDSSEPKDDHGALSTEENKIKLVKNSSETSSIENSKGASTLGSSENEKENADEGIQKHKDEHEAPPSELKTETNISDAEDIEQNTPLADENEASKLEIVKDEKSTVQVSKHIEDVSCMEVEKAKLEEEELVQKSERNSAIVAVEREAAELKAGSSSTEEPADTKNDELADGKDASKLEIVEDESTIEVPKHIEDASRVDNEKNELENEDLVEKVEGISAIVAVEREAAELKAGSSSTEEEPADTKNDELADRNDASKLEIVKDEKSTVQVSKHIEDVSCMDVEKAKLEDEELVEKSERNSAIVALEREAAELKAGSSSTEEPADTKNDELADGKDASKLEIVEDESTIEVPKHIEDASCVDNEKTELENEDLIEKVDGIPAIVAVEREAAELKAGSSSTEEEPADTKNDELADGKDASKLEIVEDESTIEVPKHIEDASRVDNEKNELENEDLVEKVEGISAIVAVEREAAELKAGSSSTEEEPADTKNDELADGNDASKLEIVKDEKSTVQVSKHIEDVSCMDVEKAKLEDEELVEKSERNSAIVALEREAAELKAGSSSTEEPADTKNDELADGKDASKLEIVEDESTIEDASCVDNEKTELENEDLIEKVEGISAIVAVEREAAELKAGSSSTEEEPADTKNDELADGNDASKLEIVEDESTIEVPKHIEDASCVDNEKTALENEDLVEKVEGISAVVAVEREAAELKAGSSGTEEKPADTKNDELADGNDASKLEIVEDESTVEVPKHIEDASCVDNEKTKLENEDFVEKVEGISAIVAVEREAAELKAGSSSTEEEPADTKNDELADGNDASKLEIVEAGSSSTEEEPADTKNDELADGNDASKLEIVEDESTIEVPKHIEDASCVDNEKTALENEDLVEKVEGISAVVAVEREAAELKAGSSSTEEEPADTKNDELADGNDASKLEIVEDESTVEVPKHIEDASCVDNEKTELENEVLVQKVEGNSAVVAVKREAGSSSTEEEPSDTKNDELADGNDASKLEIVEDESTTEVPKHTEDASCVDNEKTELENEDLVEKVEGNSAVVGVERDTTKLKARSSSNEEEPSDKKTDELLMEEADRKDEDIHTKSDHNVKSTEKILGMSVQRKEESRVPEGASLEDQDEYTYSISVVDDEKSGLAEGKDQDAKITLKCEEQLKQTPQNDGKEKLEELPDMISEGIKPEASIEYPENTNTAEEPTTTRLEKFSKKKNEAENQEVPVATDASQATSEKVTKAPGPSNTEASVSKPQEEIENTVGTLSSASVGMETGKEYPDEEESQGTKVKVTIEESKEQIEATYLIEREISNTLHGFSEPKEDHGASSMEENKNNLVENSPVLEVFEKDACSPNGSKIEFLRAVSEGNPAIQELKPVNQEQLQGSDASPEMKDVTAIETKENSLGQVEETNSRKNKDVKVQEVADEGAQRLPLNEEQKEIETSMKTDKTPARDGTLYVESGTSFIGHSEGASILGSSENEKKDANEGIEKHKDEDQALLSDLKTETNISNTEEIEQWKREQFSGLADENEGSKLETVKDEKSTLEVSKHIEVFSCIKSEKAVLEEKVLAENAEENSAVVGLEREATEMKERSPNTEEEPANTEKGETLMEKTFNDLQSDRTDENIPCESNENVEGPEEILDTSLKTKDKSLLGEHDNPTPREASIEDQDEYANSVSAAKDNDEEYSKQMLQNDGKERLEELPDMIFARSVADASREYPENTTCATGEETTARLERTSQKENIEENVKAIDDIKENKAENQEVLVTAATIQANREKMIKKKVCESSNTEDSVSKPQEIENTVRTLPSASVKIEPSKEYPEEDESEETNMKEEVKVTITESKEQIEEAYSIERKVSNISDDFFEPKEVHGDWSTEENKNTIVENSSSISGVFDKEQPETSEPTPENRNITDIESKANSLDSVNIDEKQEEETVSNEIRDLKVAEVEAESRQRLSCDIKDEALITGINHEKEVTISTPLLDDQLVRTFIDSSVLPSYEEPKTKDKTPERDGTIYVDSETSSIGHSKGDSLLGSSDNEKENADEGIQKPRDEDLYVPPELITENNISDMDYREKWKKEQVSGLADRHDACKLETVNNEEATVEVSKHMEVVTDLNSERAVPEEEELAEESEDSSAVLELEREEAAQKVASPSAEEESASTKNGELPIEKVHYKVETADNNENIKELLTGSRTISVGEETGNKVEVSNSGFKEQTEATELTVEKESVTLESHTEQNMEIIHFSASTSTDASETYSEHSSSTSKVYEKQTEAEVSKKDKAVIDDAKNDSLTVVIEETDLKKVEQVNEENNKGSDSAADNNGLTTIAAEMTTLDCKDIDERQEENSSPEKKWILDEVNEGHLKMNRCVKEIDKTTATQHEREVIISSIPMSIEEKDTMTTATFNTIETADETAETYLHARENELLQKEHEVCKPGGVTELETVDIRMECSNDNIIKLDNEDLHMLSDENTKTTSTGKDGKVTQGQENLATTFEGSLTGVSIKKAATAQYFSHEHKPADELSADKTVEAANTDEKLELASESMAKEQNDEKIYQAKGKGNTEDPIFKSSDDIPGKKLQGEAQRKSTQFEVVHHISVPQNAHETSATDGCTEKVLKGNEEANGSENILEQILGPKRISNEPDIVSAVDKTVNEVTEKNSESIKQIEEMNERESEILGNFPKANEDFSSLTTIEASEEGTQREDNKTLFRMSSLVSQEVEKEIKAEIFQKENDTHSTFQTLPCTLVNEETSFKETTEEHSRQVDNFAPFSEGKDVAITVKPSLEINDPDDIQEKSSSSEKSREYQSLEIVDEAGQNMDQDFRGQAPTTGVEHENEEGSRLTLIEHDNLQNPSVMQTEEDNHLPDKISNPMAKYLAGEDHDAEKDVHDVIRPEDFPELGIAVIEKSDNKEIQNQDDEDLNQLHNLNTQSILSYRKDVEIPRTEKGSVSTNQSEACTMEMEKDKKPCIEVSKYTADETCIESEKDSENFRSSSNFITAEKLPAESTKTEKDELPEEKILEPAHLGTKLKSSSDFEAHNQTNEQLPQIKEKSNNIQDWISVSVEHIPGQTSVTSLVTKEVRVDEAGGSENIEEQIINSEVNLMEPQILSARGATVNLVKDRNFISTKNLKATDSSEQKVIVDLTIEDDPTRKEAAVEVLKVESSTRQAESDKRNHYLASEINENVLQMPLKPIEETIPEVQRKNEEPRRATGINTGVEETEVREEKIGHLEEPQQAAAILNEEARIGSEKDDKGGDECREVDPVSGATVTVEGSKDTGVKVTHRKSHNILSGVGSKVKHSISKVKKAITGKSSHPKSLSPK